MLNLCLKTICLLSLVLLSHCGPRYKDMRTLIPKKSWTEFEQKFDRKTLVAWEKPFPLKGIDTNKLVLNFKAKNGSKPIVKYLNVKFYQRNSEAEKYALNMDKTFENMSDDRYEFPDVKLAWDKKWMCYIEVNLDGEWYSLSF